MTHYGWRNEYFSAFPNAVAIRPVDGPDVTIIPWFNIFFFVALMAAILFIRAMWLQFRERSVDPLLDAAGHQFDESAGRGVRAKGQDQPLVGTWRDQGQAVERPIRRRGSRCF